MIFLSCLILILCGFLALDLYLHKDILSPMVLNYSTTLALFMVPALFKLIYNQPISFVPDSTDSKVLIEYGNIFLFASSFSFGICYLVACHFLKKIKFPDFEIVFKSDWHFWAQILLGFASFATLMTLMPYNYWGTDAYYHMSGYGIANWMCFFTLFIPGFLFLGSKEHRWWNHLSMLLFFIITTLLLERGTQTAFIILSMFIVLRETYKVSKKWQIAFFTIVPTFILLFKFVGVFINDRTKTPWQIVSWFITFDLGRFDYYAAGLYYHLLGLQIDPITIVRYIPFATYLPVIKDLNDSFQALPEQLHLGARISPAGGIPFTANGELVIFLGFFGIILLHSLWGILFAAIYSAFRNTHNVYILGAYALFLYSARTLGFTGLGAIFGTLVFVTFFCNLKVAKKT